MRWVKKVIGLEKIGLLRYIYTQYLMFEPRNAPAVPVFNPDAIVAQTK